MSAPEHATPDDDLPGRDRASIEADERCLAVLMLLHDGRSVEPERAAWARTHVARHPHCAAAHAELVEQSAALAATPPRRARPDFTGRVLAELAAERAGTSAGGDVLPFVRRLALAAGLALALTLFTELARPTDVQADATLQRQRHAADHFRPGAFGPQDIEAGLRERLKDPSFNAQAPGARR